MIRIALPPQGEAADGKPIKDMNDAVRLRQGAALAEGFAAVRRAIEAAQAVTSASDGTESGGAGGAGPAAELSDTEFNARLAEAAELSETHYLRRRAALAKELGVAASVLDKLIKAQRAAQRGADDGLPGRAVEFDAIESWHERVDGAQLLDDLSAALGAYVAMESHQRVGCPLWTVFAHAHDLRDVAPILVVVSPKRRCGKTRLLETIARTAPRPLMLGGGVTAAALARTIEESRPTLLIDEFDALASGDAEKAEQLRGQLDSSFNRAGARMLKSVSLPGGGGVTRSFRPGRRRRRRASAGFPTLWPTGV